jgi:MHS family proline/betaine transporter-like MFS transporter
VYLLNSGNFAMSFLVLIVFGFISTIFCGPMNPLVVEVFNPTHRYRSAALSYAIGMSLFGGTAPLIASSITKLANGPFYLSCYFCIAGLMGWKAIKHIETHLEKSNSYLLKGLSTNRSKKASYGLPLSSLSKV